MTATQVFLLFLKKNCILEEYLFFRNTIMNNNGNRYFRKRRLYKNTFVEDYLSRNNRTLSNFMTRMFILAPNLKNQMWNNPRYYIIRNGWKAEHEGKEYKKYIKNKTEYADDALAIALIAIDEAKVAFLEAVEAQIEYDEIYGENEEEK